MSYTLDQVRHLAVHPFTLKEMPEHDLALIDYHLAYPDLFEGEYSHVLRDFRGVTFQISTGKIVSRPYHKFFNLGEAPETKEAVIDWSEPHVILEKLDGSMVRPYLINDQVRWATRMGLTDVAAQADRFCEGHPNILRFAKGQYQLDYTPIFEWCSRQNRVVIDHPQDRMVLTAIRDNVTGQYMSYALLQEYADAYDLDLVKSYEGEEGLAEFVQHTRGLEDAEGYVVRFKGGLFFKIKADLYVDLHRVLGLLQSEQTMIELILAGTLDDALVRFREPDRVRIQDYQRQFHEGLAKTAADVTRLVDAHRHEDRKTFALTVAKGHPAAATLFAVYGGSDALVSLKGQISKAISRLDQVAHLWGGERWGRKRARD